MTLNKMMIIGNLGADPELRYTPGGKAVAELRVAVNDRSRGPDGEWQEETQWFRVELWEQAAERAAERLRKGHKVFAEGALRAREWEGKDGQKRTSLEIRFARVQSLERRDPGRAAAAAASARPCGASDAPVARRAERAPQPRPRPPRASTSTTSPSSQRTESPCLASPRSRRESADYYRDRRRREVCNFCVDKAESIDYKEVNRLRRYLSERAKIEPRRKTGTCARHQRMLTVALKRARQVALLPYAPQHLRPDAIAPPALTDRPWTSASWSWRWR